MKMQNTNTTPDIHLLDIKTDVNLQILSDKLSQRQTNTNFMRFLKENPMTSEANFERLKKKIDEKHTVLKGIFDRTSQMIGMILFHGFDEKEKSLEISTRIDPEKQLKGIATFSKREALFDVFQNLNIEKVVSRHSAFNIGSFFANKKAGFQLIDFIENQTFLPNIQKQTDDFNRHINRDIFLSRQGDIIDQRGDRIESIKKGLIKHGFVLPEKDNNIG